MNVLRPLKELMHAKRQQMEGGLSSTPAEMLPQGSFQGSRCQPEGDSIHCFRRAVYNLGVSPQSVSANISIT